MDRFIRNCKDAESYILAKTGIKASVNKTTTYLVVNYVKDGCIQTKKIRLTGGVLYCFHEKDFKPLIEEMRR